jgi:hypothetical protein
MFGSLSPLSINNEEHGDIMTSAEAVSSPPGKPLLDEPRITATIDTGYGPGLRSARCVGEDQVWTCGDHKIMKLLNLRGKQQTSIQTKSGGWPGDIAVTRDGDLVYTDPGNNTVNLVKNNIITLQAWVPHGVCRTTYGYLLMHITMTTDDNRHSKFVRYSGFSEKQSF